jgi:hypothetical protein
MRLGKTPFDVYDGFDTLDWNTIGGNSGNLLFGAASHKLFSTKDTTVDANRYIINKSMVGRVNSEYDGFILPLANAFRPSFEDELLRTAEFIEGLKIPFLMLSGGAQLPLDRDPSALRKIEPTIKRFARAVLNKSSSLSVRGEITADYLRSLGFNDVIVVGCPSLTMNGRGHSVSTPLLSEGDPVAYNIETSTPFGGELIAEAESKYRATYVPQDAATLAMMLWGTAPYTASDPRLPLHKEHTQFANGRAEYQLDASTWIRRMSDMKFSFGPRIHGNIAAVLAGTPAVVLAHDSRTAELAGYHEIPSIDSRGDSLPKTVQALYEHADFKQFNTGHSERFDRLSDFIHENGFAHIYDTGQEQAREEYESALASITFPPAQRAIWTDWSPESIRAASVMQRRYTQMRGVEKRMNAKLAKAQATQDALLNRLGERLQVLEHTGEGPTARPQVAPKNLKRVGSLFGSRWGRIGRSLRSPRSLARRVGRHVGRRQ